MGLTQAIADCFYEAACVCLDRHHSPPQEFDLRVDSFEQKSLVRWKRTDNRSRRAWANENDTTRDGAYACALAATELSLGLCAVSRAETLTGADYYIGHREQSTEDLENCFRLEVSGTDLGTNEVNRRLGQKKKQVLNGNSNLPGITAVVGFRVKLVAMQKVYEAL